MGFQFANNWPYSSTVFPSMVDHVDPVNNEFFTGLNTELERIEYYLGNNPQGSYKDLTERLVDLSQITGKWYSTVVVSTDGVNADYSDIQTAVNAVGALGGGRVLIREGTYTIDSIINVNVSDNIIVQGMGPGTIITSNTVLGSLIHVCDIGNQYDNIIIRDIMFDGNSGQSGSVGLLQFQYTDYSQAINCYFKDSNTYGMFIEASQHCNVNGCIFNGYGTVGLRTHVSCGNILISSCQFIMPSTSGEHIKIDGTESIVTNNSTEKGSHAIQISGTYNTCSDNIIDGPNLDGINIAGQHNNIQSNTINDSGGHGISCYQEYAKISNNEINNSGDNGIYLENVSQATLCGNLIYSSSNYGIYAQNVDETSFVGNMIWNSGKHGMLMEGLENCAVTGNTLTTNGQAAGTWAEIYIDSRFTVDSTYNTFSGNSILATGNEYGVREADASQNFNEVIGNIVTGAITTNISLQGANSSADHNIT